MVGKITAVVIGVLKRLGVVNSSGSYTGGLSGLGSTDNAIVRTNGTGGTSVQGSPVTIDDTTGTTTLPSTGQVKIGSDVGLARSAAGVVRVTDGSTGTGTLEANTIQPSSGATRLLIRGPNGNAIAEVTNTTFGMINGPLQFPELASAPSGLANAARLYAVDNGAGKTQLYVIFGSGAAQLLATEP